MKTMETSTPLQDWAEAHKPSETMFYKAGYWDQIDFVRDDVPNALARSFEEYRAIKSGTVVIGEHTSKSVRLPVFRVTLADGTAFTMRCNFHDWKVSVESPRDVNADFMGLFDPNLRISDVYCEGFPEELVYGPYAESKRRFTVELSGRNYSVFTLLWIFAHQVLGKRRDSGHGA